MLVQNQLLLIVAALSLTRQQSFTRLK